METIVQQLGLQYLQMIPPAIVGLCLIYFLLRYLWLYRRPACMVRKELLAIHQQIVQLKPEQAEACLRKLKEIFATASASLKSAWDEYNETLHHQHSTLDGEYRLSKVRATVQSSVFFGSQNLVDTPLRAEYFRHLPGIVTGIGIIGTFAGLLIGLFYFDASDPVKIQDSVSILLDGVRDAFFASAAAITVAMYITNSEKAHLRLCYAALEQLTERIDHLFESGVGEEYLAALVKSSEESAIQARQLKDGLVSDLREMLQNLVDSQVRENLKLTETLGAVYRESGKDVASSISSSIEQSFSEPLQKIAESVQAASSDQSGQVQGLLQDVLMAFMNKLDASFGQQFNGLHEMMGQSVSAMQQMLGAFQSLVTDMRNAGESSSQAMNEQLNKAIADMTAGQAVMQASMNEMIANLQQAVTAIGNKAEEAGSRMGEQLERLFAESETRQQQLTAEMLSFVERLKESVGRSQEETMKEINAAVSQLGAQLGDVMKTMESSRDTLATGANQAQQQVQEGAKALVSDLSENVQALLAGLKEQQQGATHNLRQIDEVTRQTIAGMKEGAEKMRGAADRFGSAGESALKLMDASSNAAQQFNTSGATVATASRELATQVAAYQKHQEGVQRLLATVEGITASSQNEATSRAKMISDLTQVTSHMKEINIETASYLDRVGEVLERSFARFGDGVEQNLSRSLGSLDQELSKAVGALATGVQEIGDSVEELADTLGKIRR